MDIRTESCSIVSTIFCPNSSAVHIFSWQRGRDTWDLEVTEAHKSCIHRRAKVKVEKRLFGVAAFHHNFILVKNIIIRSRTMRMTEARESSDSDGRGSGGVFIFLHGVFSKYYFLDTVSKRSPKLLSRGSIFRLEAAAKNGRGCLASCHPLQGCLIYWSDLFDILMRYAKI